MTAPRGEPGDGPVPPRLMLQYLVVLAGTDPLVWRRIRVPASYSFWDLHVAIQDAMGWQDTHLHEFRVLDPRSGTLVSIGIPDGEGWDDRGIVPGWTEFPLDYTRGSPTPIQYRYDFGDDWDHAVVFEGFEQAEGRGKLKPKCVDGAGACPPEDSGGAYHYSEVIRALADPKHPQHEEFISWLGGPLDPHAFSVDEVSFDDPQQRWIRAFDEGAN